MDTPATAAIPALPPSVPTGTVGPSTAVAQVYCWADWSELEEIEGQLWKPSLYQKMDTQPGGKGVPLDEMD